MEWDSQCAPKKLVTNRPCPPGFSSGSDTTKRTARSVYPLGDLLGGMTPRLFVSWRGAISAQKDSTGMKGRLARNANIDLGLAILASTSEPPHTSRTIAAYCGCSRQRIQQIEQKALRKLRAALYRNRILKEAFENEFQGLSKSSITRTYR